MEKLRKFQEISLNNCLLSFNGGHDFQINFKTKRRLPMDHPSCFWLFLQSGFKGNNVHYNNLIYKLLTKFALITQILD